MPRAGFDVQTKNTQLLVLEDQAPNSNNSDLKEARYLNGVPNYQRLNSISLKV